MRRQPRRQAKKLEATRGGLQQWDGSVEVVSGYIPSLVRTSEAIAVATETSVPSEPSQGASPLA